MWFGKLKFQFSKFVFTFKFLSCQKPGDQILDILISVRTALYRRQRVFTREITVKVSRESWQHLIVSDNDGNSETLE